MRPHRRIRLFLLAGLLTLCGATPSLSQLVLGAGGGVSSCEGLGGDTDGDTLCDDEDPCKFFPNTLPLVISNTVEGIPDECLCGDFDGDGFLGATDAAAINECAAFIRFDCVPERDEVDGRFDGFFSATDASLVSRVVAALDPAYLLACERRPELTCGEMIGVRCGSASPPTCGNGVLDPNEDCDFGDLGGATCADKGFLFGTLACGSGCMFDTSGCTITRFVDNGDGTVSDNRTGLMWEKKVAGSGCLHCVGDRYTWFDAMGDWISEVNGFTFSGKKTQFGLAGHSDWRIPKVSELENIILLLNVNVPCPRRACIDPIFGPTGGTFYWSSSTFGSHPSSAWVIPFWFHGIGSGGFDKLSTSRVRAVRGGL